MPRNFVLLTQPAEPSTPSTQIRTEKRRRVCMGQRLPMATRAGSASMGLAPRCARSPSHAAPPVEQEDPETRRAGGPTIVAGDNSPTAWEPYPARSQRPGFSSVQGDRARAFDDNPGAERRQQDHRERAPALLSTQSSIMVVRMTRRNTSGFVKETYETSIANWGGPNPGIVHGSHADCRPVEDSAEGVHDNQALSVL